MNIWLINEINSEIKSLSTLVIENQKFPITDKDIKKLLVEINSNRPDLIEDVFDLAHLRDDEINELKDTIEDLNERLTDYEDEEFNDYIESKDLYDYEEDENETDD